MNFAHRIQLINDPNITLIKRLFSALLTSILSFFSYSQYEWAAITYGSGGTDEIDLLSIAIDNDGNSYSCGRFYGMIDFDPGIGNYPLIAHNQWDVFIRKLDSQGQLLWVIKFGGDAEDCANEIVVDNENNIVVTGYFSDTVDFDPGINISEHQVSNEITNAYVAKFDSNGNYIWSKLLSSSIHSRGKRLVVTPNNDYIISGMFLDQIDLDPNIGQDISDSPNGNQGGLYICRLNSNGNHIWGESINGTEWNEPNGLDVSENGDIYLTGSFSGTTDFDLSSGINNISALKHPAFFLMKLTSDGALNWLKIYNGYGVNTSSDVKTTADGYVYLCGYFAESLDFNPGQNPAVFNTFPRNSFLLKLDSLGNYYWVKIISGDENHADKIVIDDNGNIIIAGYYTLEADFDPGTGVSSLTTLGYRELYLSSLNSSGDLNWYYTFTTSSLSQPFDLDLRENNELFICGPLWGTVDFDPGNGIEEKLAFNISSYILKLNYPLLTEPTIDTENLIELFPNPTSGLLTIVCNENEKNATIQSVIGENVQLVDLTNGISTIDVSQLKSGIYFLVCNNSKYRFIIH